MTAREFIFSLPEKVNPAAIEGHNSILHFDLPGTGGGEFTVLIHDSKVEVKEGFEGEPKCKITAKEDDLLAILNGSLNPMMAFFTGKIKVTNQGELLKYAKILGLM